MNEIVEDAENPEANAKKIMYINRRAPYGTIYALEALEVVLIGAMFEQDVSVVFMDDGIFQLKKNQDTLALDVKNFSPAFRALETYEVEKLYVEKESMQARGLSCEDLLVPVLELSSIEIAELMEQQDVLLNF